MKYHDASALIDNLLLSLVMFGVWWNHILFFFFPFEGGGLRKTKRKQTLRSFTQSILFDAKYPLYSMSHCKVLGPSFESPSYLILD